MGNDFRSCLPGRRNFYAFYKCYPEFLRCSNERRIPVQYHKSHLALEVCTNREDGQLIFRKIVAPQCKQLSDTRSFSEEQVHHSKLPILWPKFLSFQDIVRLFPLQNKRNERLLL